MNKYGVKETVKETKIPNTYKETGPGIYSKRIRFTGAKPAPERMGAAKPWKPKGGHAKNAAKAHPPKGAVPTNKIGRGPGYNDSKGYTKPSKQKRGYTKV